MQGTAAGSETPSADDAPNEGQAEEECCKHPCKVLDRKLETNAVCESQIGLELNM